MAGDCALRRRRPQRKMTLIKKLSYSFPHTQKRAMQTGTAPSPSPFDVACDAAMEQYNYQCTRAAFMRTHVEPLREKIVEVFDSPCHLSMDDMDLLSLGFEGYAESVFEILRGLSRLHRPTSAEELQRFQLLVKEYSEKITLVWDLRDDVLKEIQVITSRNATPQPPTALLGVDITKPRTYSGAVVDVTPVRKAVPMVTSGESPVMHFKTHQEAVDAIRQAVANGEVPPHPIVHEQHWWHKFCLLPPEVWGTGCCYVIAACLQLALSPAWYTVCRPFLTLGWLHLSSKFFRR